MKVRKLLLEDIEQVVLINKFHRHEFKFSDKNELEKYLIIKSKGLYKYRDLYVITEHKEVIGYFDLEWKFDKKFDKMVSVEIKLLTIKEEFRKKGIGTRAIKYILNESIKNNCKFISLQSRRDSEQFYFKNGFKRISEKNMWMRKDI